MIQLVITDPLPPGIHLGPFQVRFYGLAYAIAFVVGTWLASRHLKRRGIEPSLTQSIAFWAILIGLIGARLYFVVQSGWWWYLTHPQHIFAFWEGGMAFFGAVFAVLIVLLWMSHRHRLVFWDLLDAGVLFAAVGQPIGRLGNFMNGEILGPASSLPWAVRYTSPETMAPHTGLAYQPANLYEAAATLLILGILLYLRHSRVPPGILGLAYLALYPLSQFLVFFWRTDYETPALLWGLKQAQLTSIFVLVVVLPVMALFWLRWRRQTKVAKTEALAV